MTVLVGIVEGGHAFMAADSLCIENHHVRVPIAPKIHRFGCALVGLAGSSVYRRALQDVMPLSSRKREDAQAWVYDLADTLRAWGNKHGHGNKEGSALLHSIDALIATPAGLWTIGQDGAVMPILPAEGPPQWAIGAGQDVALGALYTLSRAAAVLPPQYRVRLAVEAACAVSVYCALPVHVESVSGSGASDG